MKVGDEIIILRDQACGAPVWSGQVLTVEKIIGNARITAKDNVGALWMFEQSEMGVSWDLHQPLSIGIGGSLPPQSPPLIGKGLGAQLIDDGLLPNPFLAMIDKDGPKLLGPGKKCECGQSNDVGVRHSDYCQLYVKEM